MNADPEKGDQVMAEPKLPEMQVWVTLSTGEKRGPIYESDVIGDTDLVRTLDQVITLIERHNWLKTDWGRVRTSAVIEAFTVDVDDLRDGHPSGVQNHPLYQRTEPYLFEDAES
jgi:hypothetical protein